MKAIVTGASGFSGKHLRAFLEARGVEVHALSGRSPEFENVKTLAETLAKTAPDFIFHLAGIASSTESGAFYRVNAGLAATLLQALEQAGLRDRPVLLAGTSAEYGRFAASDLPVRESTAANPYNHYGASKMAQTHLGLFSAAQGRPIVIVRPSNIVGSGMPKHSALRSWAIQLAQIARGEMTPVLKVGNLDISRDFIDVQDVVEIYWKLLQNPAAAGEIVNVCSGVATKMSSALEQLISAFKVRVDVQRDPSRMGPVDVPVHYGCTEKMERLSGLRTRVTFEESISRIHAEVSQ